MIIKFTRKSLRWLFKHKVSVEKLEAGINALCKKEGQVKRCLRINIMPNAFDSNYCYWIDTLNVAVGSRGSAPRYIKLKRVCRNLLHELRHFIQYRIYKKPFTFSYSMRDMTLLNSKYWNDPDEIDARNYERTKLNYLYKKII
ncbi:MAG: hypothetical protein EBU90_02390 [Proteobacteria bacterium]|nr:hypothetical protein [Pseudomonadota bacterium]NBP13084.1 hypothetical protein [bacterium]